MSLIIYDEVTAKQQVYESNLRLGRDTSSSGYGCQERLSDFGCVPGVRKSTSRVQRVPRSEWERLIDEGKGNWLSDIRGRKIKPHNQGRTPLCWMHGSVRAMEVLRLYEGQLPKLLSAECAAKQITGGRMRGGMPEEALQHLRMVGTCEQNLWPLNSFDVNLADPSWKEDQHRHRILEWLDVENFDDQMTLALNRIPVAIGLRWWGHLVCQLDPVYLGSGVFGIGIDNSWDTTWGDWGYGILTEKYGTADLGAFAPISETFSNN